MEAAQARADALAGDQAVTRAVIIEWEGRLGRLLAVHPEAEAELARVADTLAGLLAKTSAGPPGNVTVTQHAHATGEHATVIQPRTEAGTPTCAAWSTNQPTKVTSGCIGVLTAA